MSVRKEIGTNHDSTVTVGKSFLITTPGCDQCLELYYGSILHLMSVREEMVRIMILTWQSAKAF